MLHKQWIYTSNFLQFFYVQCICKIISFHMDGITKPKACVQDGPSFVLQSWYSMNGPPNRTRMIGNADRQIQYQTRFMLNVSYSLSHRFSKTYIFVDSLGVCMQAKDTYIDAITSMYIHVSKRYLHLWIYACIAMMIHLPTIETGCCPVS